MSRATVRNFAYAENTVGVFVVTDGIVIGGGGTATVINKRVNDSPPRAHAGNVTLGTFSSSSSSAFNSAIGKKTTNIFFFTKSDLGNRAGRRKRLSAKSIRRGDPARTFFTVAKCRRSVTDSGTYEILGTVLDSEPNVFRDFHNVMCSIDAAEFKKKNRRLFFPLRVIIVLF